MMGLMTLVRHLFGVTDVRTQHAKIRTGAKSVAERAREEAAALRATRLDVSDAQYAKRIRGTGISR